MRSSVYAAYINNDSLLCFTNINWTEFISHTQTLQIHVERYVRLQPSFYRCWKFFFLLPSFAFPYYFSFCIFIRKDALQWYQRRRTLPTFVHYAYTMYWLGWLLHVFMIKLVRLRMEMRTHTLKCKHFKFMMLNYDVRCEMSNNRFLKMNWTWTIFAVQFNAMAIESEKCAQITMSAN